MSAMRADLLTGGSHPVLLPVFQLSTRRSDACGFSYPELMRTKGNGRTVDTAFADLYRKNFARLVVLASAVSGETTFAEDIVQEAMGKAHDRWEEVGNFASPEAWVRRLVVNASIDRKRRIIRESKALLKLRPTTDNVSYMPKSYPEVWEAIGKLAPRQRAAIALFYLEGHSTAEISEILGTKESTTRVLLHKGRNALRDKLGDPALLAEVGVV